MDNTYHHTALQRDDDIRLFSREVASSGLRRYHLESGPRNSRDYFALSYVWGGEEKDHEIDCDGLPLKITSSLFEALDYIFERWHGPFWIDAVCLDQHNESEKTTQIPRMPEIYSDAKSVMIWLGGPTTDSDWVFDHIPRFMAELRGFKQDGINDFPRKEDAFWPRLGDLFRHPWFGRVWTAQEAILAKHKVIVCGTRIIEWNDFEDLIKLTGIGTCREAIRKEYPRDFTMSNAILAVSHMEVVAKPISEATMFASFLSLLNSFRFRRCERDHDHIYGVLGLVHPSIRADITRRGLITYERPVNKIIVELVRAYFLTVQNGYRLLCMASATRSKLGLPSWCPDWTSGLLYSRLMSNVPSYNASGAIVAEQQISPFRMGYLENSILVRGFTIDVVDLEGDPLIPQGEGRLSQNDVENVRLWENSCRAIACSTIISPSWLEPYLRTLTGNVLKDLSPYTDDFAEPYGRWRQGLARTSEQQPDASAAVPDDFRF